MNAFVAVTDKDWFTHLQAAGDLDEVNFWQPSAAGAFQALDSGGLFLLKLHSPDDFIVGGGFFSLLDQTAGKLRLGGIWHQEWSEHAWGDARSHRALPPHPP